MSNKYFAKITEAIAADLAGSPSVGNPPATVQIDNFKLVLAFDNNTEEEISYSFRLR